MQTHLKVYAALSTIHCPKIAIVRSLPGLGDLLCSVPAFRALRGAFPNAEITLIGLPNARTFVQRFYPYIDSFLAFPGFPGIPEASVDEVQLHDFLNQAQSIKFDLALQLHGNGCHTNAFTQQLGASIYAGCYPGDGNCPDANFFLPYPDHQPEIWRSLILLEFLGIPLQGWHLEFPITEQDWQDWRKLLAISPLTVPYACIHPGASTTERRWQPGSFARIADRLAALGLQVVLTGTADERELTQIVANRMQFPAVNLAGYTSLGALALLLKKANLLVCNDTGVSHLAAALQIKSVVIFSGSDPQRWAPLNRNLHRVVQVKDRERSLANNSSIHRVLVEALNLLKMEFQHAF